MTLQSDEQGLDACGCCQAGAPPSNHDNPPGQPALRYRLDTQPTFLERMVAELSRQTVPPGSAGSPRPLAALSQRQETDFTIALLDAWATVCDVLTFYQERIANEGFLRTATERRSVLELAREIGYELGPGVAASTYLAFTVEDPPGPPGPTPIPRRAAVPVGTRIQSVPRQDETPQTFETVQAIDARREWNALRPRRRQRQHLGIPSGALELFSLDDTGAAVSLGAPSLYLDGAATKLKPGDTLLVSVQPGNRDEIDAGYDPSVLGEGYVALTVSAVSVDPAGPTTRVDFASSSPEPAPFVAYPFAAGTVDSTPRKLTPDEVLQRIVMRRWQEDDLAAFLAIQRWDPDDVLAMVSQLLASAPPPANVYALRQSVGFFGQAAPTYASLHPLSIDPDPSRNLEDWDAGRTIWEHSTRADNGGSQLYGNDVSGGSKAVDAWLERSIPNLVAPGWAVIEAPMAGPTAYVLGLVREGALAEYGISGKATGLQLWVPGVDGAPGERATVTGSPASRFTIRDTVAKVQSEELPLAGAPIADPVWDTDSSGDPTGKGAASLVLDRMVLGLAVDQWVAISGQEVGRDGSPTGAARTEMAQIAASEHAGGYTTLRFRQNLTYRYVRESLSVNANVALATHGKTVANEVLGSGDGTQSNQQFVLSKAPLTYVPAANASGAASTLVVRVGGLRWREVASLYGLPPDARGYTLRNDDDGNTAVVFGDGTCGVRLPTGQENVVATYRTGLGSAGEVAEGSLILLQTRPLGIKSVTNPLAAQGAGDPEHLESARANAPRTVLTLDRIVSLKDYEDFARSFAGIGKAQAVAVWSGQTYLVHLTIAAIDGGPLDKSLAPFKTLRAAVKAVTDGTQRVTLDDYQPRRFRLAAVLLFDKDREQAAVRAAAVAALTLAFSFGQRSFGQPVTAAEVMTVLQNVAGVVAVDLTQLNRDSDPPLPLQSVLSCQPAHYDSNAKTIVPGELLVLDPAGIDLSLSEDDS